MRYVLLLSICGAVLAAQFTMPKYNLTAGRKLCYTSSGNAVFAKGNRAFSRQLEVWVMKRNKNGSFTVILKQTENATGGGKVDSKVEVRPTETWSWCDMQPNGSIVPGSALGPADWMPLFIPLPLDTLQAKQGWERPGELDRVDRFRLDSKSLSDTVWAIEHVTKTPLDEVFEISDRALVHLNRKQGLVILREGFRNQNYGSRSAATSLKLDSVVKLDTVAAKKFVTDLTVFLRADSTVDELENQADEDAGQSERLLTRADSVLEAAMAVVKDSGLWQKLDERTVELARIGLRQPEPDGPVVLKGKPAPNWKLRDLDGNVFALKNFKGKVLVLDFWYRGCPWCIRVMPQLSKLAEDFKSQPVRVVGMNVDKDVADAKFAEKKLKLTYPTLRSLGIPKLYGVTGYPTLFLIDQKGIIRDVHIGYSPNIGRKLARQVRALLESK
jgi:peroxiredoxin